MAGRRNPLHEAPGGPAVMPFEQSSFNPEFAGPSDWAELYRSAGLQAVPARMPDFDHPERAWKMPALKEWVQFQEEMIPEAAFRRYYGPEGQFRQHRNVGLLTGRASDNVFVLDLDTHKNEGATLWWQAQLAINAYGEEPETWKQRTGGGGRQLLFKAPTGWLAPTNRTSQGVDIRGQGGFAMLPPSLHMSRESYRWEDGFAPWQVEIASAPQWLLDAIDELVDQNGGHRPERDGEPSQRTESPSQDFDAFANRVDGREDAMRAHVWAAVMDFRRQGGTPDTLEEKQAFEAALHAYLRRTKTRLANVDNIEGLERECRGPSAFLHKWQRAMKKWGTPRFEEEAAKPSPFEQKAAEAVREVSQLRAAIVGTVRTFDFADLVTREVTEEPDLIEPHLLGTGGFLLIGGPPKAQKSWFKQDILVSLALGSPFLSGMFHVPRPLRVFDLQAEMNEKLLRRRARIYQDLFTDDDLTRLRENLFVSDRFRRILDDDGIKFAVDLIKERFPDPDRPPDALSFDPMANLFDQENENDNAQVMKFLTMRIEAVRQAVNPLAGVILVHHATKKSPDEIRKDPFNCFRGGGALRGHYDSGIIIFKQSDTSEERELHFELRGGESPEPMVVKLEGGRMVKAEGAFFKGHQNGWPDIETCRLILAEIEAAWQVKKPWSTAPQTRQLGRFGPRLIVENWPSIPLKIAAEMLEKWLMNGVLSIEERDSHSKIMGLKVIGRI
jgi:hypothetical protein